MRRYDNRTKVTPDEAMAIVYGWWMSLFADGSFLPPRYIIDWLHKCRSLFSHLRTVGDVSESIRCHWGSACVRLRRVWPSLSRVGAECPQSLVHLVTLREFLHGTKTRKEAAQKAKKKRACGLKVGKAKRP